MLIKINDEVKKALDSGKGVVALESTIISHGMPYPENVKTALTAEQVIRDNGAIPATIAIIKGVPTVGLTKEEIDEMLNEALQMGKLLNKDDKNFKETKEKDIEGEVQGDDGTKKSANAKKITLHDFS